MSVAEIIDTLENKVGNSKNKRFRKKILKLKDRISTICKNHAKTIMRLKRLKTQYETLKYQLIAGH
jgi:hypothetical protein